MMTSTKPPPNIQRQAAAGYQSINDIVDVSTSTLATRKLISYTISHFLMKRGIYPPEMFIPRNLREGVEVFVLKRPDPARDYHPDSLEQGNINVLHAMAQTLDGINNRNLHSRSDPTVVHEEWRFEVEYKDSSCDLHSNFPTQQAQSLVLFSSPVAPAMTSDDVVNVFLQAFRKMDSFIRKVKPFDFENSDQDVCLGMVLYVEAEAEGAVQLRELDFSKVASRHDTGDVKDASKLKIGTFSFPFHEVSIKVKTNRY